MPLPTPEQERAAIIAFVALGTLALIGGISLIVAIAFVLCAWVFA